MTPARTGVSLSPRRGSAAERGRLRAVDYAGFARGTAGTSHNGEGSPTICEHEVSAGYPWCVEHDPTGTCLGAVRRLPGGGAAWLEGAGTTTLRITLGRPRRGNLSQLSAAQTRELITVLEDLSAQMSSPCT